MDAHQLIHDYLEDRLIPENQEQEQIQAYIRRVTNVLKNNSTFRPMEIRVAGSFAKKTMLAGRYEADLEFYYNRKQTEYRELLQNAFEILKSNFKTAEVDSTPMAVKVEFDNDVSIDVVPGFKANSPIQMAEVNNKNQYVVTTGQIHVEYAKAQKVLYPIYPNIVRLAKNWRDEWELDLKSINIELIVSVVLSKAYTYGIDKYDYLDVFKEFLGKVMSFCDGKPIRPVNWNHVKPHQITAKKSPAGVLIVDLGNPADNLTQKMSSESIKRLREIAVECIQRIDDNEWEELWDEQYFYHVYDDESYG